MFYFVEITINKPYNHIRYTGNLSENDFKHNKSSVRVGLSGNTVFFHFSPFFRAGTGLKSVQLNTVRVRKLRNERVLHVP